jgi:hypothetical protein
MIGNNYEVSKKREKKKKFFLGKKNRECEHDDPEIQRISSKKFAGRRLKNELATSSHQK